MFGTKTETLVGSKPTSKSAVTLTQKKEETKPEIRDIQKTIQLLTDAREVVKTKWLRGGWAETEQETENGTKKFDEPHYCALGALQHADGVRDSQIGDIVAIKMFEDNDYLFKALVHAFRRQVDDVGWDEEDKDDDLFDSFVDVITDYNDSSDTSKRDVERKFTSAITFLKKKLK